MYSIPQKYTPMYVEILDNGITKLIIPICKFWRKKEFCSLGHFNGFQVYDFIYSKDLTLAQLSKYLLFMLRALRVTAISLYNVPESSLIYQWAITPELHTEISPHLTPNDNVSISFAHGYDTWRSSLSKHSRQNLRTAYIRLSSDHVDLYCRVYYKEEIGRVLHNQLIDIYCDRHSRRYHVHTSSLKSFYLKYFDFSTDCLKNPVSNLHAILYLNGKVSAFMSGLIEKDDTSVIVPRLSIDDSYARYSPGLLLISETLRYLATNTNVSTLDLSKGAEGYKLSAGGTIYSTYTIILTRNN